MKQMLNINIPNPCHENWNKMTVTDKGRFCKLCTKEVIDFTYLSDEQLINHFSKNQKLCGKFKASQLNRNIGLKRKNKRLVSSTVFASLFSLLIFNSQSVKAQEKPKTEQTDKKYTSIPLNNILNNSEITVTGTIVDENNIPLPGATVIIKDTTNCTSTDFEGHFSLSCNTGDVLTVSYIGYNNLEIIAKTNQVNLQLQLNYDCDLIMMGAVKTKPLKKRWIGGNLYTRFTNLFRKENINPKFKSN